MTSEDPFEELFRRIYREVREMLSHFESSMFYDDLEKMFDERMRMIEDGRMEPIVSVQDMGDKYLIIIDLPGAKEGTIQVKVYENKIDVSAEIDAKMVGEALGEYQWARSIRRFEGSYSLPEPIDVKKIRLERKATTIVLHAPKKRYHKS